MGWISNLLKRRVLGFNYLIQELIMKLLWSAFQGNAWVICAVPTSILIIIINQNGSIEQTGSASFPARCLRHPTFESSCRKRKDHWWFWSFSGFVHAIGKEYLYQMNITLFIGRWIPRKEECRVAASRHHWTGTTRQSPMFPQLTKMAATTSMMTY